MTFSVTSSTTNGQAGSTRTVSTAGTSGSNTSSTAKLGQAAGLGKDDFMQLLIAQLKNQDPMKPMEDKEFITQLAQFSSLEALDKLNEQMQELVGSQLLVQAAGLIGKTITAKLPDGTVVTGSVSRVKMVEGKPRLLVNGTEVDAALVTQVGPDAAPATAPPATTPPATTAPGATQPASTPTAPPAGATTPAAGTAPTTTPPTAPAASAARTAVR
ncbi:MAG: hypothetical protein IT305_22640 [Chloroflexi bacterium]|nr:hypothetical protein [Chloroflexota bacterium]